MSTNYGRLRTFSREELAAELLVAEHHLLWEDGPDVVRVRVLGLVLPLLADCLHIKNMEFVEVKKKVCDCE